MKRLLLFAVPSLLLVLALGACAPAATTDESGAEGVDSFENATYSHPIGDAESATVTLTQSIWDTTISALDDAELLVDAEFDFVGDMVFNATGMVEKELIIAQDNEDVVYEGEDSGQWQIAVSTTLPVSFDIEGSIGALDADLSALDIPTLALDMSTGDVTLALPARDDGIALDFSGSLGALDLTIPADTAVTTADPVTLSGGTTTLHIGEGASWSAALEMSTGDLVLEVTPEAAVRVTISESSVGSFVPEIEMTQVETGEDDDSGVWETPDYADADATIDITVEMSIGDLIVR